MSSSPGRVPSIPSVLSNDEAVNRFERALIAKLRPVLANTVLAMTDWRICEDSTGQFLIQRRTGFNRWETAWSILAVQSQTGTTVNNYTNSYTTAAGGATVAWTSISLLNGWTNAAPGGSLLPVWRSPGEPANLVYPQPQWMRDADGFVHLRGQILSPSTSSAGVTTPAAFSLPVGAAPLKVLRDWVNGTTHPVLLDTSGNYYDPSPFGTGAALYDLQQIPPYQVVLP